VYVAKAKKRKNNNAPINAACFAKVPQISDRTDSRSVCVKSHLPMYLANVRLQAYHKKSQPKGLAFAFAKIGKS